MPDPQLYRTNNIGNSLVTTNCYHKFFAYQKSLKAVKEVFTKNGLRGKNPIGPLVKSLL